MLMRKIRKIPESTVIYSIIETYQADFLMLEISVVKPVIPRIKRKLRSYQDVFYTLIRKVKHKLI